VVDGLGYVARRNNTFSLHVHVGVRGADRAVRTSDRLRPVLPVLLAFSANSPFVDGTDAGLHSARTQTFTRMFPRCGVPDAYGSWIAYHDYIDLLIRTGSVVEYTQVWWSVRPHFSYGTVEVRICDAQSTAAESEALAGLIVACVAQAARDVEEGVPFTDPAPRMIEENTWRAVRHGMDGDLLDLDAGVEIPAVAAVDALAEWTAPMRAELGIELPRAGERPNGAQRQIAAREAGMDLRELYASTVQETAETYGMAAEVPR
jgi:carboxylate-amine ligase